MADTITLNPQDVNDLTEMLEDTVAYFCQQVAEEGRLISGQTAYLLMECFAATKGAEFQGLLKPDTVDLD